MFNQKWRSINDPNDRQVISLRSFTIVEFHNDPFKVQKPQIQNCSNSKRSLNLIKIVGFFRDRLIFQEFLKFSLILQFQNLC